MEPLIEQRLNELNPQYRAFIESDFIDQITQTFSEANDFNEQKSDVLVNAITLYLLFFLKEEETVSFIANNCGLDVRSASDLFEAMKLSLPEGMSGMVKQTKLSLEAVSVGDSLDSEIAKTEKEFAALPTQGMGMRTMADDMRTAQSTIPTTPSAPTYQPIYPTPPEIIHTSNQSDIFPAPPPPAPNQNQNLPTRWDSERQ